MITAAFANAVVKGTNRMTPMAEETQRHRWDFYALYLRVTALIATVLGPPTESSVGSEMTGPQNPTTADKEGNT